MKKTVFVIIMLLAMTAQAQKEETYGKFFADRFTNEINGYIFGRDRTEEIYSSFIRPPEFYDFDLIRMVSRRIVNSFSDVKVLKSWEADQKNPRDFTEWWITDDSYFIVLTYSEGSRYLMVSAIKFDKD